MLAPAIVGCLTAVVGAWIYRRFAAGRVLDTPNQRSSHTRPTPRGGGVAIVAGFLIGLALWLANGGSLSPRALGWLAGAVLVAGVSFVGGLRAVAALARLVTPLLGAALITPAGGEERARPPFRALPH